MRKLTALGAKVLVRSLNGGTKMRGRVPGPAGIVEDGPSQSDQVSIACADNGFRLHKIGDETHRDDRHCGGCFDRPGKRDLVAWAHRDLLRRAEPAAGDVDRTAAVCLK